MQSPEVENANPESGIPSERRGSLEHAPPGARVAAWLRWALVAAMAAVAVLSVVYSFGLFGAGEASAAAPIYHCPMHPQIVQDHPGDCPICGMTLVLREPQHEPEHRHAPSSPSAAPAASTSAGAARAGGPVPGLAPLTLTLDRTQLIGMKSAVAAEKQLGGTLSLTGVVAADEARRARVHSRFAGWIERLAVATTGEPVRAGQVVAELYSPELLPAQEEYLSARRWAAGAGGAPGGLHAVTGASLEHDARGRLELLGLSAAEIDRIASTGRPQRVVAVRAPAKGIVVAKNVAVGQYVGPETELVEIADLSRVWVIAEAYDRDVARLNVGSTVKVSLEAYPEETFPGRIGFIYPMVDPSSRTLRVRVELENRESKLRPGLFAKLQVELAERRGLFVPASAVIDTGEAQYCFVALEGGRFEPRIVRVGRTAGEDIEITEGLEPGARVVTTANFLLDSESRLRAAVAGVE